MNRRSFILGAMLAPPRCSMGIASTCYPRNRQLTEPFALLAHAADLGAGVIQAALPADPAHFRAECERRGMYYEAMIGLRQASDESVLKRALDAGALCARVACLAGRRYETFDSLEAWHQWVRDTKVSLAGAVKAAERVRLPLAVENHKDWTAEELPALLKSYSSEYLAVCLDTGNNIALLDDPYEAIDALAPYAISVHFKDVGVASHHDGFLLAEVPLGEGMLDLARIVKTIRRARFNLEMLTREPLVVPCLTEKYWATFENRAPQRLAHALRLVRDHDMPLDHPTLPQEEENVRKCLHVARERLGL